MPRRLAILLIAAAESLVCGAVSAQQAAVARRTVQGEAEDYLMRPLGDTNLKKRRIAPVLAAAVDDPYNRDGLRNCAYITAAIGELDAALGPDVDELRSRRKENVGQKAGRLGLATAREFIGGIVPVRSIVREVSGARAWDARFREAVYAGAIRRGFLKGLAAARRCEPPVLQTAEPAEATAHRGKAAG